MFRFFIAALAMASAAGAAQIGPIGSEFLVNTHTVTAEFRSKVAANASGFVVVWDSLLDQDGDAGGVFAQRFTSSGTRLGVEFQVNSFTTFYQYYVDVAMDAEGDFVVAWQSFGQDAFSSGVFAQRFASDGAPLGLEFQVNTSTTENEREASIAMDLDGNFVVAWTSVDGIGDGVFAQRFDSTGMKVGVEFLANTHTASTQRSPKVAMSDVGFVVVWQSFGQDGEPDYGVFARRFASNGAPLGVEFQVNLTTFSTQRHPDVAMGGDGDFVVVWDSFQGGDATEVIGRHFDSNGASPDGEFLVNMQTVNFQGNPAVAKDATGAFVVTWTNFTDAVAIDDVFARFFDSAGVAQDSEIRVNFQTGTFTIRQGNSAVATAAAAKFIVSWESSEADGEFDVFARRVVPFAALDLDRDGVMRPLTDGVLALRFLLDFEGASLVAGVVGDGCTRCSAEAIEEYAAGLGLLLDVNDTNSLGLIDGLLLVRYLFGVTGVALEGTPESGCTRCESDEIVEYLLPLTTRE